MKKLLVSLSVFAFAGMLFAQRSTELNNPGPHLFPAKNAAGRSGAGGNLIFHTGGKVLRNAHVVMIFWGPSFVSGGADYTYAQTMQAFRTNFGTTHEYNVITQYYGTDDSNGSYGNIMPATLNGGPADYFDSRTPPTNVTDAIVQGEVQSVITAQGLTDYAAIYEVFIPSGSYSSSGTSTSCGGPNLAYCAYHGYYTDAAGKAVKYSIEPWAGCSGCSSFNNPTYDQEHFVCHETREAVTDSELNAWYDHRGYEADDKCAWNPAPFIDGSFAYQDEWANNVSNCVQKQ